MHRPSAPARPLSRALARPVALTLIALVLLPLAGPTGC